MNELNEVLAGTDWDLFATQKGLLVQVCLGRDLTAPESQELLGLLNWIDNVQDAYANVVGESLVFPRLSEEYDA